MKKSTVGGQAVLEGVMMKNNQKISLAVRKPDGDVIVENSIMPSVKDKVKILKMPVLRGIVNFIEIMILGVKTLSRSAEIFGAEEQEPTKFEKWLAEKTNTKIENIIIVFAMVLGLGFAMLLFSLLPTFLVGLLKPIIENHVVLSLIEGLVRLLIFVLYILLVSRMNDIKRVFEYHGAEHKTIHCSEHDEELTIENVSKYSTLHPRCGTAFLLIVMVLAIILFSLLSWDSVLTRIVIKLALLPFVAGVAYEIIRFAGRSNSKIMKIIIWPGLMMQKLTTREPDDKQIEVAIKAFNGATVDFDKIYNDGLANESD